MASPSASAGYSMPAFVQFKPTTTLAFERDKRYHVFLSFRGPDTRKKLVDHLYQALSAAGLYVFIDSDKLEKGEIVGLSLKKAIESSAICIPIFSKGYAESDWCLKEAAAILSTCDFIIPLFYDVKPTEVRYPDKKKSPYKKSFDKHYGHLDRQTKEEVDGWKNALSKICERSGWTLDEDAHGFEARLVKMVVKDVMRIFDRRPFEVAKHPVGMESVKNILIQKLNFSCIKEVVKVGIWGIGGFGKTAVAKAVYNQIYDDFDDASFIFNVRANAADLKGLPKLQKQILQDLTKYEGQVQSVDKGKSLFMDRLGGRRVLLILDDVDADVQLDALVGDWLAPGSRVIITSRNKHILHIAGVSSDCIHKMKGLGIIEGLELFRWHAFPRASPSPRSPNPIYEGLSKRIVEACKGHPLSLEVIGSFLSSKQNHPSCWTEALSNITVNPGIYNRLYISYSALSDVEKEIFVDIACLFIGESKKIPTLFWNSLYEMVDTSLCNLADKSLINIDDEDVFDMHDHLRDMGRTIAKKEKKGTRLWEAPHLSTISNNNNFYRLQLNGVNPQRLEMLCGPGLCYLHLQNLLIEGMTEDTLAMLPPSLVWLRLENCRFSIKVNRATKQPRISISEDGNWQLKTVQLNFCHGIDNLSISSLFSLPNIKLQHLDLRGCRNLNNLPVTIGNLSQLQHLDLEGCVRLKNLPDIIGNLSQLEHLNLRECRNLNNLPDTIGKLSQLQHLDLEGCVKLKSLPDTIDNLSKLEYLRWKDGKNAMFI